MDCRTAQLLLPYAARPAELGPEDAADLNAHVAACPQCGALARAERSFDAAVGRAMNAVPVPAGLQGQIQARLAKARGPAWRKPLMQLTAAAAALAIVGSLIWLGTHKTAVHPENVAVVFDDFIATLDNNPDAVKEYFRRHGVNAEIPDDFDFSAVAWYEVARFKGHDVARLDFQRGEAKAHVYVLARSHFRLEKGAPLKYEASRCTVEVINVSKDVLILVVYQSGATRQHFQKTAIVG